MKNITIRPVSGFTGGLLTLAVAGMLALPTLVSAQGGRGASLLLPARVHRPATASAPKTSTGCASCSDKVITVVQTPARGVGIETKRIARHECSACQRKTEVTGHGKTKTIKTVHVCRMMDAMPANCCTGK